MAEDSVTGNLKLEVDRQGLEARINFTRDPDGAVWTKEKILKLLAQKNIKSGLDNQLIDSFCFDVKKAKGPYSFIAAKGVPPELGQPPEFSIATGDIPDDLQQEANLVIQADQTPTVFERTVEKIRVDKAVRKKKLPFLPAKETIETTWNKKVSVRPVKVETAEIGRGYAESGVLVARVRPGKQPKPGRDIFGKEIVSGRTGPTGILLSPGLKDQGQEIRAEEPGFFRYGDNWIELFTFQQHEISIDTSSDGLNCLLNYKPGSVSDTLPSADLIVRLSEKTGFKPEDLLPPGEINELIARAAAENKTLENRSISRPITSEIRLEIGEDKQQALLTLKKGRGSGEALDLKTIGDAIRSAALKGMDVKRVKQDLLTFFHGEKLELDSYVLVSGKAPAVGEDGSIDWKVSFLSKEETENIKAAARVHPEKLQTLSSGKEFPLEALEEIALIKDRETVALVRPPSQGEDGVDVHGTKLPGEKGKEIQVKLFDNLQTIKNEIVALCSGVLEKTVRDDVVLLRARPHRDRKIELQVSEDKMEAKLTLLPSAGTGQELDPQEVHQELEKQGVIKGVDKEVLAEAILKAKSGESVRGLVIAKGQAPKDGTGRTLNFLVHKASGSAVTFTDDGRADYRNQDRITTVAKDEALAEIPPPEPSEDGWDISGKTIAAEEGRPSTVQMGRNVAQVTDPDGRIRYVSKIAGVLSWEGNSLDVLNVHAVENDVDLHTGNISFSGAVYIKGSVQSGFKVLSGERIIVDEMVQGALLSAGESIVIQQGIKGGGKAVLRAKKDIQAYFSEQAVLLAVGDIRIQNASLRCHIKCNGKVYLESDKGNLVGGTLRARVGLEAANIGSERGIATSISFGQDYLIGDRIELESREVEKLQMRNQELDAVLRRIERSPDPDQKALEDFRHEKRYTMKIMEKRIHRLFKLREKFEEHFDSEVVVKGTTHPGVVLESHGREYKILTPARATRFYFDQESGRIEAKALK